MLKANQVAGKIVEMIFDAKHYKNGKVVLYTIIFFESIIEDPILSLIIMMRILAEVIGSLVIRYIHFFSSIMWWGCLSMFCWIRALNTTR